MKPVLRTQLLSNADFVAQRPRLERVHSSVKEQRRLKLGDAMVLLFENQATVIWQVQEMCRVENIGAEAAIQHELDTYNALLPGHSELSATLLIGYADPEERNRRLRELRGLHLHLHLNIEGAGSASARFDAEQFNEERVSSVQFLRIPLSPAQRAGLLDFGKKATFVVDHPAYTVEVPLPAALRGALVEDLETP
jgi:hypothetical protein